jgi:8-oxo-dGTP diphosphatase
MERKSHCPFCGGPLLRKRIEGRLRLNCNLCRRTLYENPTPATCLVVIDPGNRVLLVKRSVDPRKGQWCLPGGFIELGESPEEGALRELTEETGLRGQIERLMGVRSTPSVQYDGIIMIAYLVRQYDGHLVAGDDAQEADWFSNEHLPAIAFDSHAFFIRQYYQSSHPA